MRTAILLAGLMACNNPPPAPGASEVTPGAIAEPGEKVLSVNGTPVGANELDLVFQRMKVPTEQRAEFAWTMGGKHVAEEYALATVLYQKAVDEKLYADPAVQLQLAFAERQVLAAAMREKLAKSSVTEEAIKKYYEDNKERFSKPEVHARHILVADAVEAKDLSERIAKGEDFAQLAADHSIDQGTKRKGGDVGWFHQHENPLWGDAAFAAKKGAVLGPLQSRLGWHLVEVLDARGATPLEAIRDEASEQIEHQQAVSVIDALRTEMKVEWVKEPAGDRAGAQAHAGDPSQGGAAVATPGEPPPDGGKPAAHGGSPHGKAKAGKGEGAAP